VTGEDAREPDAVLQVADEEPLAAEVRERLAREACERERRVEGVAEIVREPGPRLACS
jgi:hypothetical protein